MTHALSAYNVRGYYEPRERERGRQQETLIRGPTTVVSSVLDNYRAGAQSIKLYILPSHAHSLEIFAKKV